MSKILYILIFCFFFVSCNLKKENSKRESSPDTESLNSHQKPKGSKQNSKQNEIELSKIEFQDVIQDVEVFSKFEFFNSTVLYDENNNTKSLEHIKKDSLHVILLEKINEGDEPTRQITDTIHFISYSDNHNTSLVECENINNPKMELVFGFFNYEEEKEYFDNIVFAWKVDLLNEKLKPIESKGIRCINISYSL